MATADFNNDGHPDYLLYNAASRQTAIWYLNNNVYVSGVYGPNSSLVGAGSLVARVSGPLAAYKKFRPRWFVKGTHAENPAPARKRLYPKKDPNSGDHFDRSLSRLTTMEAFQTTKPKKGTTMNPPAHFRKLRILPLLIALALVARSADAYLAAISDFNGDGHPDYVLENGNTNQTAIWYLNNNVFVSDVHGPTLPAGWGVVGVADFKQRWASRLSAT